MGPKTMESAKKSLSNRFEMAMSTDKEFYE